MADQSRPPVTGYPAAGYPPPQASNNQNGHSNTAATAYPYAAPPHTQNNAAYYNPNPYYTQPYVDDHRALFLRRVFTIIVAAFIIAGTIAFIIWLILRPQLPAVRIDSLSVNNLNLSSSPSSISGNWDVRFTFRNPNGKITLYYDRIEGYVYYQRASLSETAVPPFFQGKKGESPARATFAASSAFIEKPVSDGMIEDKGRGAVTFNVRLSTRVEFKAGLWWTRRRFVRVYCGDLRVGFSSNSSSSSNEENLTSGARECKVGL